MNKICIHCKRPITFNPDLRKWVTSKDNWKCGNDRKFPVRAHEPEDLQ